jgi:hypothetical protein
MKSQHCESGAPACRSGGTLPRVQWSARCNLTFAFVYDDRIDLTARAIQYFWCTYVPKVLSDTPATESAQTPEGQDANWRPTVGKRPLLTFRFPARALGQGRLRAADHRAAGEGFSQLGPA